MREITVNLYQYNELSEKAQEKARDWYRRASEGDSWWEYIYEDAANVGLKIKGFDIDRGARVDMEFISGALDCAVAIMKEHGETCETYKTAAAYIVERDAAIAKVPADENGDPDEYSIDEALDPIDAEFLKSLEGDYLKMLRDEYEHETSDEAVVENIELNEYEFTEDGVRA